MIAFKYIDFDTWQIAIKNRWCICLIFSNNRFKNVKKEFFKNEMKSDFCQYLCDVNIGIQDGRWEYADVVLSEDVTDIYSAKINSIKC